MEKRVLHFDVLSGISGDMTVGALLDLDDKVTFQDILHELEKINLHHYKIKANNTMKNGIKGTKFDVVIEEHEHEHVPNHNSYKKIIELIDKSELNDNVKELSKKMFLIIGEAEAKIHNTTLDEVHFHEVGAIDSIVDIVGVAICIDKLDIDLITSSHVHVGTGFVKSQHGVIPVPAPATLEILKGVPIYSKGIRSELVTPTGATILKTLASTFEDLQDIEIEKIGYGHGTKDLEITNTLRVVLGKKKQNFLKK